MGPYREGDPPTRYGFAYRPIEGYRGYTEVVSDGAQVVRSRAMRHDAAADVALPERKRYRSRCCDRNGLVVATIEAHHCTIAAIKRAKETML